MKRRWLSTVYIAQEENHNKPQSMKSWISQAMTSIHQTRLTAYNPPNNEYYQQSLPWKRDEHVAILRY